MANAGNSCLKTCVCLSLISLVLFCLVTGSVALRPTGILRNHPDAGAESPADNSETAPAPTADDGIADVAAAGPDKSTTPSAPIGNASSPPSADGLKVFDITKYGAKADGKTDSVQGFMQAWIAACKNSKEPAKVVVPKGTFLTSPVVFQGPCVSTAPITVEVQGTIIASSDLSEYSEDFWFVFERINGLILNGGGTFNGKGPDAWKYNDCKKNSDCTRLPSSIKIQSVKDAVVSNIYSVDSKYFHMHVTDSNNFTAYNLNIIAPGNSPNTDGIHLSDTDKIHIYNTTIGTGDDCISIGQGVTNAVITQVTCGPGHGISVGSLGKFKQEADVAGITVTNCTLTGTDNGVRIKSYAPSDPSNAKDITFQDIIMNSVKNPIIINQKYGTRQSSKPSSVKISGVTYKNIKGTSTSPTIYNFLCSSSVPCDGITIQDVDLAYQGPVKASGKAPPSSCLNAKVTTGGTLNPPAPCH